MARGVGTGGFRLFRVDEGATRDLEASRAAEFERLYRESFSTVYGYVLFKVRDREVACDVTSEAFLRAARYFARYNRETAKFSTWVISIARNCVVDYYRKHKDHASIDDVPMAVLATDADQVERVHDADLASRLLAVLADEDREIVRMKYLEGWGNSEIARELGMNPSTVSTRIQRALSKMRDALEKMDDGERR